MWRNVCIALVAIAILAFLASLPLPALHFAHKAEKVWSGFYMFFWGWAGPLGGIMHWYANIPLVAALWAVGRRNYLFAFGAGIIGLYGAYDLHGYAALPWWEGGNPSELPIRAFGFGYWLWVASFVSAALAGILGLLADKSKNVPEPVRTRRRPATNPAPHPPAPITTAVATPNREQPLMKVLVIGSGGREHALAWKLAQSPRISQVLVAPGNAGTANEAKCRNVEIDTTDLYALIELATRENVAVTVVGPEGPLVAGVVDRFRKVGLRIFGPTAAAAQLEGSKAFAKDFLARHGIPTAHYAVHTNVDEALAYVRDKGAPIVVKADGLAAGKGVIVAMTLAEAEAAITDMLAGNAFGAAGARVVIEEFLDGEEASFISMVDGNTALPMATSQDHKRVGDGDTGPNTGGMGAYSPAPVVTPEVHARVMREIVEPTVRGMAADGVPFTGFLYAGLMIDKAGAPKVIEFNVRFGDPETQPVMMRLQSDLLDLVDAAIDIRLHDTTAQWDLRPSLGVVMAAENYPGTPRLGDPISSWDVPDVPDTKVFHAGTKLVDGQVVTAGGRVLCVCALGETVADAQKKAYAEVSGISWHGEFHRHDIGWRAVERREY